MLAEVGNCVGNDAAPVVFVDEGVAGYPFDVQEDGSADSDIVAVVEGSDGAVDGECVDEVFEEGEVFVEGGVWFVNCHEFSGLGVEVEIGPGCCFPVRPVFFGEKKDEVFGFHLASHDVGKQGLGDPPQVFFYEGQRGNTSLGPCGLSKGRVVDAWDGGLEGLGEGIELVVESTYFAGVLEEVLAQGVDVVLGFCRISCEVRDRVGESGEARVVFGGLIITNGHLVVWRCRLVDGCSLG